MQNSHLRLHNNLQAIKHAFLLLHSNDVLKGQINQLKTMKRMMYSLVRKTGSLQSLLFKIIKVSMEIL